MIPDKTLSVIVDRILGSLEVGLKSFFKKSTIKQKSKKHLKAQFNNLVSWSSQIELYDLGHAVNIFDYTLNLSVKPSAKRISNRESIDPIGLDTLQNTETNILILGDPGSGKTTCVKRLIQLLFKKCESNKETQIPIVFQLRKIDVNKPLVNILARYLGIGYYVEQKEDQYYIADNNLEDVIIEVLEDMNAIIVLDGLDEVDHNQRNALIDDVVDLSRKLSKTNTILTSRSGNYNSLIEGFSVFEIIPLNEIQIEQIASKWTDDSTEFFTNLKEQTYFDIVDRPLTLVNILIFYQNKGYLPDQPSSIYENITELYIENWDKNRRVKRESKYSHFTPNQKLRFLSELAYHLLYKMGSTYISFTKNNLKEVYEQIHSHFRLPKDEKEEVLAEIESHNGLVIKNYDNSYSFSHLTFQEYLAANYIVKNTIADVAFDLLTKRAGPVAVAVSLSSNPNNWLDSIFGNINLDNRLANNEHQIIEFLKRLYLEKPFFYESGLTGFTLIKLSFLFFTNEDVLNSISTLLLDDSLRNSFVRSLKTYSKTDSDLMQGFSKLTLKRQPEISNNFVAKYSGILPKTFISKYV